jgi:hypothetical protein
MSQENDDFNTATVEDFLWNVVWEGDSGRVAHQARRRIARAMVTYESDAAKTAADAIKTLKHHHIEQLDLLNKITHEMLSQINPTRTAIANATRGPN